MNRGMPPPFHFESILFPIFPMASHRISHFNPHVESLEYTKVWWWSHAASFATSSACSLPQLTSWSSIYLYVLGLSSMIMAVLLSVWLMAILTSSLLSFVHSKPLIIPISFDCRTVQRHAKGNFGKDISLTLVVCITTPLN